MNTTITIFLPNNATKVFTTGESGVMEIKYKKQVAKIIFDNGNALCYSGIPFIVNETL